MRESRILDLEEGLGDVRAEPTQPLRPDRQPGRRKGRLADSELETSPGGIDRLIEWLLIGLLAFMPLALGVVAPWSETVAVGVTGLIAVLVAVRATRDRQFIWSWSFLPIALFIGLVLLQLIPLPEGVVRWISPQTIETKRQLLGDLPGGHAPDGRVTLSFYPLGGYRDLRLILIAVTLFVSVVQVFRQPAQVKRLLGAIAVIGGAVATLAFLQHVTGATKVYWFIPSFGAADGGPFINRNNYTQFANLAIGAALGLLLVKVREELKEHFTVQDVVRRVQEPEFRTTWWLIGIIVLLAVTILLSLSRAGMISMVVALSFSVLVLSARQRMRAHSWLLLLVGAVIFVGALYAGIDAVVDRFAALGRGDDPLAGRSQIYQDAWVAWKSYPAVGLGQGTWAVTYPMFNRSSSAGLAYHADAEYAQVAFEVGAAGMIIALVFVGFIWTNYIRAVRASRPAVCTAAVGLGYGLLAIMIQSSADYGQRIPAVAALTAVTCGMLVALGRLARLATVPPAEPANEYGRTTTGLMGNVGRVAGVSVTLGLVAAIGWALLAVNTERAAAAHWDRAESYAWWLEQKDWRGSDESYTELLSSATAAVQARPKNVEYRYWINLWRWYAITRAGAAGGEEIAMTSEELGFVERIVQELHEARRLCPTYAQLYSLAGQLEWFVLDQPEVGATHINTGYALSRNDPATSFAAARWDLENGRLDEALEKFRRCVLLDPMYFRDIVDACIASKNPRLAIAVATGDARYLHQVANMLKAAGEDALGLEAQDEFLKEMKQANDPSGGYLAAAARMHSDRKEFEPAIEFYRKAISRKYDQVGWRLELAKALAATGQTDAAMREARLGMRLRPHDARAKALVEELSVKSR